MARTWTENSVFIDTLFENLHKNTINEVFLKPLNSLQYQFILILNNDYCFV